MQGRFWIRLFACETGPAVPLKDRGAVTAPGVDIRRPVESSTELVPTERWTIGCAVAPRSRPPQIARGPEPSGQHAR